MVRTRKVKQGLRAGRIGGQVDGDVAYVANVARRKLAFAGKFLSPPSLLGGIYLVHAYCMNYLRTTIILRGRSTSGWRT